MTRTFLARTAAALARPSSANTNLLFQAARTDIIGGLREALFVAKLNPKSIAAGHKIIAARSTAFSRLHAALQNLYNNPLEEKESTNDLYLRFTNHPTE